MFERLHITRSGHTSDKPVKGMVNMRYHFFVFFLAVKLKQQNSPNDAKLMSKMP